MQSLTKVAFLSVSGQFSLFVLHTIIGTQMSLDFSHFSWVLYIYFLRKVISYKTWEGVVLWEPFEVSSAPSLADTQCGPLTSSSFPPHSLIFSFTSDLGWGCDTVNELCTTVLQNTFCLLYLTKTSFSLLFLPNYYLTMFFSVSYYLDIRNLHIQPREEQKMRSDMLCRHYSTFYDLTFFQQPPSASPVYYQ